MAGLRSSCSYAGAANLEEFHEFARRPGPVPLRLRRGPAAAHQLVRAVPDPETPTPDPRRCSDAIRPSRSAWPTEPGPWRPRRHVLRRGRGHQTLQQVLGGVRDVCAARWKASSLALDGLRCRRFCVRTEGGVMHLGMGRRRLELFSGRMSRHRVDLNAPDRLRGAQLDLCAPPQRRPPRPPSSRSPPLGGRLGRTEASEPT